MKTDNNLSVNEQLIEDKYYEMKQKNINVDILHPALGQIKIYINTPPKRELFSVQINNDTVYIGTN